MIMDEHDTNPNAAGSRSPLAEEKPGDVHLKRGHARAAEARRLALSGRCRAW